MYTKPRTVSGAILLLCLILFAGDIGRAQADPPTDWGGGGEGYELSVDRTEKHGGKASGSVKATPEAKTFGTLMQVFKADDYAGKRLRLTAFVKSNDVDDWAGLWMRVDGKEKTALVFDNMEDRKITGATDWKKYEIVLDLPQESAEIYFGILLAGKGQVWVDDFKLEAVGKDVKTTGKEIEPVERKTELVKDLPKLPKNLDFEQ